MIDQSEDITIQDFGEEDSGGFSIKSILNLILLNWYWIALSVAICYAAAHFYLKYTVPVYTASVKVLIRESNQRSNSDMQALGEIYNSSGFNNELEIISSAAIAERVVKNLKLYTTYSKEGKIVDHELYKNSPILVDIAENRLQALNTSINLVITKKGKGIHVDGSVGGDAQEHPSFSQDIVSLPATINTTAGPVILQKNPGQELGNERLFASIHPLEGTGRAYSAKITSTNTGRNTVASISVTETQPARAIDFLNELINSYNRDADETKNEVATKTENFIKDRLEIIRSELDITESDIENFKKENKMINLPNNATWAFSSSNEFQRKQVEMQTQMTLLKSLLDYLKDPENAFQIIPSNLGITNNQLMQEISTYNNNVIQRNRLLKSGSESNPTIAKLTEELETQWPMLSYTLEAIYKDLQVQKNTIDEQYAIYSGKVSNTPTQERILTNITRQQEIKAGLYLMLLQKREQNFISLASTATKARMIDSPQLGGRIAPNDKQIKMIALVVGFLFPIAILYLLSLLRYRIEGREDVERLTKIPILSDIPLANKLGKGERAIVVSENSNNIMEETFRGLRTNLRFVLTPEEKVIICTSCIPGEGKTFVATNLAMSIALLGKKVIIVGLDIRKPRLVNLFELPSTKQGITSFLIQDKPDFNLLEDQIFHGVKNANLDVLPAGIIPPNPAELLSRPLLDQAIDHLREKYDYIILDTPPIGLVSDTLDLGRVADATLFVTRADYSIKANFDMINSIRNEEKLPKVNLVLNGIDLTKRRYGYYYGYGKYSTYGKYGKYGYYGHYSNYGSYGIYGQYGGYKTEEPQKGKYHTER